MTTKFLNDTEALKMFTPRGMGGSPAYPRALICTGEGEYDLRDITDPDAIAAAPESGDLTEALRPFAPISEGERLVRIA